MAVNGALTGGELTALDTDDHVCELWLAYVPDTVVGTATLGAVGTIFGEINVSSPSAGWVDGLKDMAVKITSPGGVVRGYYRLRTNPGANTLYTEMIGPGDGGLVTLKNPGGVATGDTASIIARYDLWTLKPRWAGDYIGQDYDIQVGTYHSAPEHIINCTINGQAGHYATHLQTGTTQAITAVVSAIKWPTGSGTPTYLWTVPDDWTGVSGETTATLTATAPVGTGWVYCDVTFPTGGTTRIRRWVGIYNDSTPPVRVLVDGITDTRDLVGRRVTVRISRSEAANIPPGAMCVLFGTQTWGGADVASASHSFCGYVDSRNWDVGVGNWETSLSIMGPMDVFGLMRSAAHVFGYSGAASSWRELPAVISNMQFVLWWVLRWRTTFLPLFNVSLPDVSGGVVGNTSGRSKSFDLSVGTVRDQLQALAKMYRLNVGCRSDGEMVAARLPKYVASKAGLTTRGTVDATRYQNVTVTGREQPECGGAVVNGWYSDLSTTTRVKGTSPYIMQTGRGGTDANEEGMLFDSLSEAGQFSGDLMAAENNPYPEVTVNFRNNWDVIEPVDMLPVVVEIPANKSPTGADISLTTIPTSVTKNYLAGRRAQISMSGEGLTDGADGFSEVIPEPNNSPYQPAPIAPINPVIPPVTPPPLDIDNNPVPGTIPGGGEPGVGIGLAAWYCTATEVYRVPDLTLTTPVPYGITPTGAQNVEMAIADPAGGYTRAMYVLTWGTAGTAGTVTRVYRTRDAWAGSVRWTAGGTVAGRYDKVIGRYGAPGRLQIYSAAGGGATATYNFTVDEQGWTVISGGQATYHAGAGWGENYPTDGIDITSPTFSSRYVESVTIKANANFTGTNPLLYVFAQNAFTPIYASVAGGATDTVTLTVQETITGFAVRFDPYVGDQEHTSLLITEISYVYDGGASGTAQVWYSANSGDTWSDLQLIGNSPGNYGGFDGTRAGGSSIAAKAGGAERATALGGAYAEVVAGVDPICVVYPVHRKGSRGLANNAANADYLLAAGSLITGHSLWWVTGGTLMTGITPTVSGGTLVGVSDHCISTYWGTNIAYLGSAGGTVYAAVSSDGGSTWPYINVIAGAKSIRYRRLSGGGSVLIVGGDNGIHYSLNGGSAWTQKLAGTAIIYAEWVG